MTSRVIKLTMLNRHQQSSLYHTTQKTKYNVVTVHNHKVNCRCQVHKGHLPCPEIRDEFKLRGNSMCNQNLSSHPTHFRLLERCVPVFPRQGIHNADISESMGWLLQLAVRTLYLIPDCDVHMLLRSNALPQKVIYSKSTAKKVTGKATYITWKYINEFWGFTCKTNIGHLACPRVRLRINSDHLEIFWYAT